MMTTETICHSGSCHCGAVRFEVDAPANIKARSCTCSICAKTGFLHLIVENEAFRISSGKNNLTDYRFNTETAQHLFCKTCGVKAFYVPRSHPNGWSVNVHCIDKTTVNSITITEFDGANWEANIAEIR